MILRFSSSDARVTSRTCSGLKTSSLLSMSATDGPTIGAIGNRLRPNRWNGTPLNFFGLNPPRINFIPRVLMTLTRTPFAVCFAPYERAVIGFFLPVMNAVFCDVSTLTASPIRRVDAL